MKNTINEARRPANKQIGQHLFKGLRYDINGNPLYTCDTLSNEEAQAMGWKFSPKYGLYGQLSDPTMFYESKKKTVRLTESQLKRVISESVKKVLNEGFYPDEIYGAGASWDGFADEESPIVPIRFGEQNRPKFKKMTDEAYHLLQELRYNVATKEQQDEIVQAMKLVRHACMGR